MVWKVKEVKELLKDKHDDDIVLFFEFDYGSEAYTSEATIGRISTRKPKRTEFDHKECKFCEIITIKDNKRNYCSKNDELLKMYDMFSCENFEHKEYEIEYTN